MARALARHHAHHGRTDRDERAAGATGWTARGPGAVPGPHGGPPTMTRATQTEREGSANSAAEMTIARYSCGLYIDRKLAGVLLGRTAQSMAD